MRLIQRYLLGQALVACIGGTALFGVVLVAGNALRDLLGYASQGQISPWTTVRLLGLLVPFVGTYALPLGLLGGTLLLLGRLCAQHEITALRAAGVGIGQIAAPFLLLALVGVAASVAVNFHYGPLCRGEYRRTLAEAVRTDPLSFLVPRTFVRDFPELVLYIGSREGEILRDLWIWELDEQRRVVRTVRARSGVVSLDTRELALLLRLERAQVELRDADDPENFERDLPALSFASTPEPIRLPLGRLLGERSTRTSLSWMTFGELSAERVRLLAVARAGGEGAVEARRRAARIDLLVQERLATAFAPLSFVLVAVPLGLRFRRRETSANLVIAVGLALTYYLLLVFLGWLDGKPELRPDLLVWIPNLLFQSLGLALLARAGRG